MQSSGAHAPRESGFMSNADVVRCPEMDREMSTTAEGSSSLNATPQDPDNLTQSPNQLVFIIFTRGW